MAKIKKLKLQNKNLQEELNVANYKLLKQCLIYLKVVINCVLLRLYVVFVVLKVSEI